VRVKGSAKGVDGHKAGEAALGHMGSMMDKGRALAIRQSQEAAKPMRLTTSTGASRDEEEATPTEASEEAEAAGVQQRTGHGRSTSLEPMAITHPQTSLGCFDEKRYR
jgi:hypothetical protein